MTHAFPDPDATHSDVVAVPEPVAVEQPKDYLLSDKAYYLLRALVGIILPAVSALIFALGGIWNIPHTTEIIGTIAAVTVFLGAVLAFGRTSYDNSDAKYDGVINLAENDDGKKVYSLELNTLTPEEIGDKSNVNFKVNS